MVEQWSSKPEVVGSNPIFPACIVGILRNIRRGPNLRTRSQILDWNLLCATTLGFLRIHHNTGNYRTKPTILHIGTVRLCLCLCYNFYRYEGKRSNASNCVTISL